jgi:type I restriction enzyme R subunit
VEAAKYREKRNLPAEVFTVFWLLNRRNVPNAEDTAIRMGEAFTRHPHWANME